MKEQQDDLLKAHFRALKQADEAHTPPFEQMWTAARPTPRPLHRWRGTMQWAAAAVLLVALGLATLLGPWRGSTGADEAPSLATWQSPTEALMRPPSPVPSSIIATGSAGSASVPLWDWRSPTRTLLPLE